ncbi:uncharacterized protein LOC142607357 isoform X2 [Castanea sativa]|uniref:uncharacterized protein LOC142607357 isoform X2 n=1 Tax=Castanea sativa TaxID=21020 RepID=UPI003F6529ED
MSGGFFRGTSADQDTRFSNKQAKLLKSQKFAPELEHVVEMKKVNMDVIRPWVAHRVTELIGFEDEVLINFIYSLLEEKEVNGKAVQIQLTGFMEKNTVKFMKELWALLLSAQNTASGVPQQFLDAKEEEIKKKKAEADRMANEIEKKKEKESRELEQERSKKMDGVVETRATNAALEPNLKHRASSDYPEDGKEAEKRNNGVKGRHRISRSPHSAKRSPSPPRGSPSRSISRSRSSYSEHKSRSVSRSPEARGRSVSSERVYRSPRRRSVTPRRRHSPMHSLSPRRRSSYSRRRSRSRSQSHRRSPSPVRRRLRSPFRRRSPFPVRHRRSPSPPRRRRSPSPIRRHRSPSPIRRRRSPSPLRRRRSPSPIRRRRSPSPVRRRRSPSPVQRRRTPSPVRRRSPSLVRRRAHSPIRRRSPSPIRRRSPLPNRSRSSSPLQRSPSPVRRRYRRSPTPPHDSPPVRRRPPTLGRRRSRSPSPSAISIPSPSPSPSPSPTTTKYHRSPVRSPKERIRTNEKLSFAQKSPSSLRSPQRDSRDRSDTRKRVPVSLSAPGKSPALSESPPRARKRVSSEDRSPYQSPVRQTGNQMTRDASFSPAGKPHHDSLESSEEAGEPNYVRDDMNNKSKSSQKRSIHSSSVNNQKDSPMKVHYKEGLSPERLADRRATESQTRSDKMELRKKDEEKKRSGFPPESPGKQKSPTSYKDSLLGDRQHLSYAGEGKLSDEKIRSRSKNVDGNRRPSETALDSVGKVDYNKHMASTDSGSEESDKHRTEEKKRRKHKRSERKEVASDDDYSYDSELDDRKEAKRRRKEEKKLRKEEKRRRREERRRRKEERRAEKLKMKNRDGSYASDGEHTARRESNPSDDEDMQSEQKRLEIELRKKALESLKAKKGISH